MPKKSFILTLAMATALPLSVARAEEGRTVGHDLDLFVPAVRMAQLSPEERERLRERWRATPLEERERLRKEFGERMRERREGRPGLPMRQRVDGYGLGFERRQLEWESTGDMPEHGVRTGDGPRHPGGRR